MSEQKRWLVKQTELLVLEDNELVLRGLVSLIHTSTPWVAHGFSHYEDALKFIETHPVTVMLVDFQFDLFPGYTGIDFLEVAKKVQPEAIQVLLSGRLQKPDTIEAINRLNLFHLMEKPFKPEGLLAILDRAVQKHQDDLAEKKYILDLKETNERLLVADRELREANSRLHKTQEDLLRQQKQAAIGALVQGICHNVNTPLGLILGHAEELSERLEQFEEENGYPPVVWRPSLRVVMEAVERIQALTQNLISKSRMEQAAGKLWLSLEESVRQELNFLQADAFLRHRVSLSFDFQEKLPKIYMNYADFSQIFGNLIRNALDALLGVAEPKLHFQLFQHKSSLCFALHDNGPGVPVELRGRIFDPFFTTKRLAGEADVPRDAASESLVEQQEKEKTWKRHMSGSGLGLYSVAQTVESYGGSVDVKTSEVLGGACFCVFFPIDA